MSNLRHTSLLHGAIVTLTAVVVGCSAEPGAPEDVGEARSALTGGAWYPTGDLTSPRLSHRATMLFDNRVLVTGSSQGAPLSSHVEVYAPEKGTWQAAAPLLEGRGAHTATMVITPAGPRVLVAGGQGGVSNDVLASAELYDPMADVWSAAQPMSSPRRDHTATLLPDGRVLVAGGGPIAAEIYDPVKDTWTATAPMNLPRANHVAILLPTGLVLVAGAGGPGGTPPMFGASAEELDPATGTWTAVGSMKEPRGMATATLLAGDRVLIAGGFDFFMPPFTSQTAEIYDGALKQFVTVVPMQAARGEHDAVTLVDGSVLIAGGQQVNLGSQAAADRYDPAAGAFVATAPLSTPRNGLSLTVLPDGTALAAGGSDGNGVLATSEIYRLDGSSSSSSGASSSGTGSSSGTVSSSGGASSSGTASSGGGSSSGRPGGSPDVILHGCAHRAPAPGELGPILAALALGAAARRRARGKRDARG